MKTSDIALWPARSGTRTCRSGRRPTSFPESDLGLRWIRPSRGLAVSEIYLQNKNRKEEKRLKRLLPFAQLFWHNGNNSFLYWPKTCHETWFNSSLEFSTTKTWPEKCFLKWKLNLCESTTIVFRSTQNFCLQTLLWCPRLFSSKQEIYIVKQYYCIIHLVRLDNKHTKKWIWSFLNFSPNFNVQKNKVALFDHSEMIG